MQIWAETGKSALPIHNYSQILYQFLTFTQNLKQSQEESEYTFPMPRLLTLLSKKQTTVERFGLLCSSQHV